VSRPSWPDLTLKAIASWRARRRAEAALHGLDDRTLQDLGIARAEIDALVADRAAARRPFP
jgi:uncharacterized protein YjiS (DUF1127 family)